MLQGANNNKGKVKRPVTVPLHVTAEGEVTWPFLQEGFGRLPLTVVPPRALTESKKMGITHIKEAKRQ